MSYPLSRRAARFFTLLSLLGAGILLFTGVVQGGVQVVPAPSHVFFGDVAIEDAPAPDDAVVSAKINGVTLATSTTVNGTYGIDTPALTVPGDDPDTPEKEGGVDGDPIIFYVDGVAVTMFLQGAVLLVQVNSVPFKSGDANRVNLTAPPPTPTPIPSVTEWGLLVLAGLLAAALLLRVPRKATGGSG